MHFPHWVMVGHNHLKTQTTGSYDYHPEAVKIPVRIYFSFSSRLLCADELFGCEVKKCQGTWEQSKTIVDLRNSTQQKDDSRETNGLTRVYVLVQLRSALGSSVKGIPDYIKEQQDMVMGECAKLKHQASSSESISQKNKVPLVNQLTFLGQTFSRLVDLTLGLLVQRIVDYLDSNSSTLLHAAIACLITLGLDGEHMCFIIAREGGVRGLLEICRRDSMSFTCSQALRALATVCCAPECIAEFELERGVESLLDLLCDFNTGYERVQGEAAGVVAQLTSPGLQNGHNLPGLLENLYRLLQALLNLSSKTQNHEVFLLSVAAIANITFLHKQSCSILLQLQAPRLLVMASSMPKASSLFAKDQIATIFANIATSQACQKAIRQQDGVHLLVSFLYERPLTSYGPAETAACSHVQQKAAIALSRLCCDGTLANKVIITRGIPRLVELCRCSAARNNSDSVLIACLAALRKICDVCGTSEIGRQDLQQLVYPQLMESFLICSHKDENFV
ncbi:hypothetical protein C0Q70_11345 [Pomacea canaliculata]|uniref:Protein inscuteable homologue C-terminal domain-containing protein n=1 Tax=Pomacea canaliculata TaxID=400727 RepID=A0A2T7P5Q5_POMCA|nr:hypothetical protein C0Q70_11345 [Pomacea canaliculata]